jgi:nitrile hydratase subunit beta
LVSGGFIHLGWRGSDENIAARPTTARRTKIMSQELGRSVKPLANIVKAEGADPLFQAGDAVKISVRFPVGHYRVPTYIRGKRARVEAVVEPAAINNEDEGFGRNAGVKRHYYRIAILLSELWEGYAGSKNDGLRIEVFETWLERS